MKYILSMLLLFLLSLISTIVLCSVTTFLNFWILFFEFFICLFLGVVFYNLVVFSVCKFIEKKYDI